MDTKELLKFFKCVIIIIAILIGLKMIIDSGFMLNSLKIECEKFNIEVSGQEKNTQPR